MSDGDCGEGSSWEAILFAAQHHFDNLTVVVDYNKVQALGYCKDVLDLEPLGDKIRAAGWAYKEVDGHDVEQIAAALERLPFEPGNNFDIAVNILGSLLLFLYMFTGKRRVLDKWEGSVFVFLYACYLLILFLP